MKGPYDLTWEGGFAATLDEIRQLAAALPPRRSEPIKLTRQQIEMLRDPTPPPSPPPYVHGSAVGGLTGVPIVEVATVEESTPYTEGWIST